MKVSFKLPEELTLRSLIIGAIGSAILTASSLYIALKMGALPWPIVFAVLASAGALRLFKSTNLHEVNVTHAAMSAGAMIAGGLAFTIPALWITNPDASISITEILAVALGGTLLGLVACALFQPYFIRKKKLTFPIGVSAADTLKATAHNKGKDARGLFAGMGISALWAVARDVFHFLPSIVFSTKALPGIAFGMMNSPMMWALGFIVGPLMAGVWFIGAIIGNFGIAWGFPLLHLTDAQSADAIRTSLGLGLMLGVGAGVVVLNLGTSLYERYVSKKKAFSVVYDNEEKSKQLSINRVWVVLSSLLVASIACVYLNVSPLASAVVILSAWFCVWLAGWLTGTSGVNPMEIFGVIVLLLVHFLFASTDMKTLFMCAGVVAVACGIAGDVMCDLKAGDIINTNPKAQFTGMVVGGFVGAIVASLLLFGLLVVFKPAAFGPNAQFVAAQATVVATMAGGIPHVPAFMIGMLIGFVLALFKLPVMTLGLGVYLPFFISSAAAFGALLRVVFDRLQKNKTKEQQTENSSMAQAFASGVLGGESLVGVITALVALAMLGSML